MRFIYPNCPFKFALLCPSGNCCTVDFQELSDFGGIEICHNITLKQDYVVVNGVMLLMLHRRSMFDCRAMSDDGEDHGG